MLKTPQGFYNSKENRILATKWLVDRLGKEPRDITQEDFHANRLRGLMGSSNYSPFEALYEAGLVSRQDETYMRSRNHSS